MKNRFAKQWGALLLALSLLAPMTLPAYTMENASTNDVNFSSDIVYQIVTDRFKDGDPTNNPTGDLFSADKSNLKKYQGGDWQGIIDCINDGYLTEMGITAIWISQPVENVYTVLNDPLGSTSYHGYWARDFKKNNPYFGDMAKFNQLIEVAHNHNLKVIIDFAPNHTSPANSEIPTYMENGALYDNSILISTYSTDPNHTFYHNGGTDFSTIEDGTYRNLFDLADLNQQNEIVDKYLKDAIKLWLDKGIDGIRMDAVKHMPLGWQKSFMSEVYGHRQVFTFGEWFLSENEVDPANHQFANESGMSLLDFEYAQKLRQVLRNKSDGWTGFEKMINATASSYSEVSDQVTFMDNHDMDRFKSAGTSDTDVNMALVVTLTSRGVPNIYYGTEQYMEGNGDPNNRHFMTGYGRDTNAYKLIQKLSAIRTTNPALAYGDTETRWINDNVYIYERELGANVVLTAVNKSRTANYRITGLKSALPGGTYQDKLNTLMQGNDIAVSASGEVTPFDLGAGEAAVWAYKKQDTTPVIGHVGPMLGKAGQTVTIDGEGFGNGQGTVTFGVTNATVLSWSDTQIKATIPAISGKSNISIHKTGGQQSNLYKNFEALSDDQVSVRFKVNNAYTRPGENIYLVGNVPELGNWVPANAIGPMYNKVVSQYPVWYFDVSVPKGTNIEFKFIKKDATGQIIWENGNNHTYLTPTNTTGTAEVNWQ